MLVIPIMLVMPFILVMPFMQGSYDIWSMPVFLPGFWQDPCVLFWIRSRSYFGNYTAGIICPNVPIRYFLHLISHLHISHTCRPRFNCSHRNHKTLLLQCVYLYFPQLFFTPETIIFELDIIFHVAISVGQRWLIHNSRN